MKKQITKLLIIALCLLIYGNSMAQGEFITTWKTTASNESITSPTGTGAFSYTVDWRDGTTDTTVYTGPATHTYSANSYLI